MSPEALIFPISHFLKDLSHSAMCYPGPDILVFTGPPRPGSGASATNTVVMSNGQLDWNRPDTFTAMLDRQDRISLNTWQERVPGRHVVLALQLLWQPERPEEPWNWAKSFCTTAFLGRGSVEGFFVRRWWEIDWRCIPSCATLSHLAIVFGQCHYEFLLAKPN